MEFGISTLADGPRGQAERAAALVHAQLLNEADPTTLELAPCGSEIIIQLCRAADPSTAIAEARRTLEDLEHISEEKIKNDNVSQKSVPLHSRRFYTDCRLLQSLVDLRDPDMRYADEALWFGAIRRLDIAIVVAGAPGEGRLDLILDIIELIQAEYLPIKAPYPDIFQEPSMKDADPASPPRIESIAPVTISRISPPSLPAFRGTSSTFPFILPGFICDWPALTVHPWRSPSYLRRISGRGRVVPVEIGSDYRTEEWSQQMMLWEKFLHDIGIDDGSEALTYSGQGRNPGVENGQRGEDAVYLAQHNLLTQFPVLRSDILVPDYVYASLPAPASYPAYLPPGNDEQLVINAWLGPKGTVSPAHTDPYFNCYAQVVGRKTVWLAPPQFQDEMYPFPNPSAPHATRQDLSFSTAKDPTVGSQSLEPSLANTSRVDVFAPLDTARFPLFESHVRPHALCAVLEPGDLLHIPPGWWHAMRSEDVSFSVSMWF